jgi:RNA 2',3'-cyclic 3'-phosphodiesterase
MSTFRGFIAIEINAFPKMFEFINDIKKTGAALKLVDLQNIHVTLKFLGDVEEKHLKAIKKSMIEIAKDVKPFTISLEGADVFPNKKYMKVLWIGIKQATMLSTLAYGLNDSLSLLGFKKEKKSFMPHLTIARVKTSKNKQQLVDVVKKYDAELFGTQTIHSIVLKKSVLRSTGPLYTTLFTADFL